MALRSRVRIRDSDPGFRKLKKRFEGPDRVDVGVFGEQGSDLVIYTAANEFGTKTIPERSFIRAATDEAKDEFARFLANGVQNLFRGRTTKVQLLGRLGLLGVTKIVEKIDRGPFTPIKPSTIRQKGSSKPLIDTGRMRQSITTRLEGKVKK